MKVVWGRSGKITGPRLAAALKDVDSDKVLNFGTLDEGDINKPEAVALASNKGQALRIMSDAGVPTPTLYTPQSEDFLWRDNTCLVGRPDHHTKGRQFHIIRSKQGFRHAYRAGCRHFMQFIDAPHEFRVHVINNLVVKMSEKLGGNGVVRSFRHGWRFQSPTVGSEEREPARVAARAAVKSLGLDFGAVDVLFKDGRAWVLEVNTAPSLIDSTLDTYIRHFKEMVEDMV